MKRKDHCLDFTDDFIDLDAIKDKILSKPQKNEDKILSYLKSGHFVWLIRALAFDWFLPENLDFLSGESPYKPVRSVRVHIYTDGEWNWDTVLTYYVENYHYKVSDEFVEHMKKNNWQVPQLTKKQIKSIFKGS